LGGSWHGCAGLDWTNAIIRKELSHGPGEAVWSSWLTPQQIADLTGLGGDFGGDGTEFVDAVPYLFISSHLP
jgi:hypothetical protein